MVLIIPAIELVNGLCRRRIEGPPGTELYYTELQQYPERYAQLLRMENARSLHVVDLDALDLGMSSDKNASAIRRIVDSVDIPIELFSIFRTKEECESWLSHGVFRLVISDLVVSSADAVATLVRQYTPSRIVLGIRAQNRFVTVAGETLSDVDLALRARTLGIRRVIYSDISWEGTYSGPDFQLLRSFAQELCMNITIAGGIDGPHELWHCNTLQQYGVDSVIVGRAFAENRFPCQFIWRHVEIQSLKK